MNDVEEKGRDVKNDLELYKIGIEAQMHFNELLIRSRTTVITIAMGVMGATVIALRELNVYFCWGRVHIGVVIPLMGLVFLIGQFIIDFFYYFRLLLGAVDFTEALDRRYADKGGLGLTSAIVKTVSRSRAKLVLAMFYIIPMVLAVVLILFIVLCMGPRSAAQEAMTCVTESGLR